MTITKKKARVAFQGEHGAFSEEAALTALGRDIVTVPCETFIDLFESVERGLADYVIAPIENTVAGPVKPVLNLLSSSALKHEAEIAIPIQQCLIGCDNSSIESIRRVSSHPVALSQCKQFFAVNPQIEQVEADDTAVSVRRVVEEADPGKAAIASSRAAAVYGGKILINGLEDQQNNYTRFLLLANPAFKNTHANRGRAATQTTSMCTAG
jgi:prephenate dehydratase